MADIIAGRDTGRAGPPYIAFEEGFLRIRLPGVDLRVQWTPVPLAQAKDRRDRWIEAWPIYRFLKPAAGLAGEHPYAANLPAAGEDDSVLARKRAAFESFRAVIPAPIAHAVEPFASHQWHCLKLLQAQRLALDVFHGNPALAYALANNAEIRNVADDVAAIQAAYYALHKQRAILWFLEFPETEAVVRIFKKIRAESVCPSLLRRLRLVIAQDDVQQALSHLKEINAGVWEWVVNPLLFPLATPHLLDEISVNPEDRVWGETPAAVEDRVRHVQEMAPQRRLAPFTGLAQVRQFCAEIDAEYLAYRGAGAECAKSTRALPARRERSPTFRNPPIPGTSDIQPLTTPDALKREGREQRNCVGTYAPRVQRNELYVYKVLAPERATLAIVLGADGCWRRGELKRADNQAVRQSTKNRIDHWLQQHQV